MKVLIFELSDGLQHVHGSAVEAVLKLDFLVGQIVDDGSLFDELVLLVQSLVLDLLLGILENVLF